MAVQTTALRKAIAALTALAAGDLAKLWRQLAASAGRVDALHAAVPALLAKYGAAAATYAADWYDDQRDALTIPGNFRALAADPGDGGANALVGWAVATATSDDALLTLLSGGLQRRIADSARKTVMDSSNADPEADGWQRYAGPDACGFCRMLADRGDVYTEDTADFGAHDDCDCHAGPAFRTEKRVKVKSYTKSARYIEDDKQRAKANKRTRDWMRRNDYL